MDIVIELTAADIAPQSAEEAADHWLGKYTDALKLIEAQRLQIALQEQALYVFEQNSEELSKTFEVLYAAGVISRRPNYSIAQMVAELLKDIDVLRSRLAESVAVAMGAQ